MGGGLQRFPVTDGKCQEGGIPQGTHQGVRVCVCVEDKLAKEFSQRRQRETERVCVCAISHRVQVYQRFLPPESPDSVKCLRP